MNNGYEWSEEAKKLLKFRDQKLRKLDQETNEDSLQQKRSLIEKRIAEAAREHRQNEDAFAHGRLDLVSSEYLKAMCVDYSELKTAGVAYRHKKLDVDSKLPDLRTSDKEESKSPGREVVTMERLVSKELDNDRGSEKIHHVSKEAELVINAKKNTELIKSMLEPRAGPGGNRNVYHSSENLESIGVFEGSIEQKNYPLPVPSFTRVADLQPQTSPPQFETFSNYPYPGSMPPFQPVPYQQPQHTQPLNVHGQPQFNYEQPAMELKKTRTGTLPPRNNAEVHKGPSRSKAPKALRKMENIARKHGL